MRRLLNYFLRGLVLVAPLAITLYVCWVIFERIDGWLGLPVPGLGFLVTIVLITLVGFFGSNLITRGMIAIVDTALGRLPFVRLLYTSTKDLLNAFVGEKRRFDKPVLVRMSTLTDARMVGFVLRRAELEHVVGRRVGGDVGREDRSRVGLVAALEAEELAGLRREIERARRAIRARVECAGLLATDGDLRTVATGVDGVSFDRSRREVLLERSGRHTDGRRPTRGEEDEKETHCRVGNGSCARVFSGSRASSPNEPISDRGRRWRR